MPVKSSVSKDPKAIKRFLTRGVENVYPDPNIESTVEKALLSGKQLRAYLGIDPTGPSLHLGHAIPMRKLAELQTLGHEVILLIGDFTAMIGDPTDKTAARKRLTRKEVLKNCRNYKTQASRFLRFTGKNAAVIKYNSKWLGKMSFNDVIDLASHFTVQQILERDMFARRFYTQVLCPDCNKYFLVSSHKLSTPTIKDWEEGTLAINLPDNQVCTFKGHEFRLSDNRLQRMTDRAVIPPKPIYLHEFLYPLMQSQDSVVMDVDIELGGNDQTFNMLAGRTLMKAVTGKEKFVVSTKLLVDPSGKKMGKSEGNMVSLDDSPEEMFGKVMNWTDGMIIPGFKLCTESSDNEIDQFQDWINKGENPFKYKLLLAEAVVRTFISSNAAEKARENFSLIHQKHQVPEKMPQHRIHSNAYIIDILVDMKLVLSKSDARRQIEQGGVKVDGKVVKDVNATVKAGNVIQKGKRHFVKLV